MPRRREIVTAATDEELKSPPYFKRLQLAVRNTDLGERDWPTAIQHSLMIADMRGTVFQYATREHFPIPLIDDVWGNERYVREFLAFDECKYPAKDRLIDIFFRIEMPEIARHFGR